MTLKQEIIEALECFKEQQETGVTTRKYCRGENVKKPEDLIERIKNVTSDSNSSKIG